MLSFISLRDPKTRDALEIKQVYIADDGSVILDSVSSDILAFNLADRNFEYLKEGLGIDFYELNDRRASDVLDLLEQGVERLGSLEKLSRRKKKPDPAQSGTVLAIMAFWSYQHPDAVWRIDAEMV